MRPYRGKCIADGREFKGKWVYGDLIKSQDRYYIHPHVQKVNVEGHLGRLVVMHEVDPETVGQYTEVHDDTEDEAELFAGDIAEVKYEGEKHICKVQYCGSGYMFVADSLPDGYMWISSFIEFDREYCWAEKTKKIGNIHDHPHLLGGRE